MFSLQLNSAKAPWLHNETQLAWYRTLYENLPCLYLTLNSKGKILSVNPFEAARLGYAVDELVGQPVFNLFHWPHRQRLEAAITALWHDSASWGGDWEFRLASKSSGISWVKV